MSGGGENAQFGATAAMVAAATTAAMQDSQPFSQVNHQEFTTVNEIAFRKIAFFDKKYLTTLSSGVGTEYILKFIIMKSLPSIYLNSKQKPLNVNQLIKST